MKLSITLSNQKETNGGLEQTRDLIKTALYLCIFKTRGGLALSMPAQSHLQPRILAKLGTVHPIGSHSPATFVVIPAPSVMCLTYPHTIISLSFPSFLPYSIFGQHLILQWLVNKLLSLTFSLFVSSSKPQPYKKASSLPNDTLNCLFKGRVCINLRFMHLVLEMGVMTFFFC